MSTRDAQTVDFDHHNPEFGSDQGARFTALRHDCPIAFTENHGGFWVASTFGHAKRILSDSASFTVEFSEDGTTGGKLIPSSTTAPRIVPGVLDGPEHDRLRDPLRRVFSRGPIEQTVGPIARRVAAELLAPLLERASFDFASEYSFRLTVGMIFEFVGLGQVEDKTGFIRMLEDAFAIDPEAGVARDALAASAAERFAAATEMVRTTARARAEQPAEDLLTVMVQPESGLTEDDVVALALSIVLGGVRTTAASLDNMIVHLDRDRELRRHLIDEPGQIPNAVNELIRIYSVTPLVARTARVDADFDGVTVRAGDRVAALIASANLDEDRFPDPQEVKLDRRDGLHLAFGNGLHYCLGIWLAKLELRVAVETVLREMPDYVVVPERSRRYSLVGVNNGFAELTVRPRA